MVIVLPIYNSCLKSHEPSVNIPDVTESRTMIHSGIFIRIPTSINRPISITQYCHGWGRQLTVCIVDTARL